MGFLSKLRRFHAEEGVMAIEFAFIAPVMLFTMFGLIEVTDAIMARRRVDMAASMMGDLTTNIMDDWIHEDDVQAIFDVGENVLHPYGMRDIYARMTAITYDPDKEEMVVVWARCEFNGLAVSPETDDQDEQQNHSCQNEGEIFDRLKANQSMLDDELVVQENYHLVVTEMTYSFQSSLSNIIFEPFQINVQELRLPRRTAKLDLCTDQGCSSGRAWDANAKRPTS
ncbi:TadE/TadG family type IV pilus assembly protein [Parvularcula dongshanensis]|uniref:TadE-like domain-containing protein n=1 Tax=Parvularcula dongshanensis TaxID=1173995 RepID=A0A840I7Y3_9PROT|nr:TadE/TadG family type IV pilus assembly protein [Parvularcula dongshanensis]MBB4660070.1 hypothetical protein [Parvularcula dongshanensis]